MLWEKKKDEKSLPDLPRSSAPNMPPSLRGYQFQDEFEPNEIHELPSFPDSPMQRGFSQSAIKDAVTNDEIHDTQVMPEFKSTAVPANYNVVEMNDWSAPSSVASNLRMPPKMKDSKPIFVRLDKFQLAHNSLETVKAKLSDIEELLKRIRDVKTREDAELSSWEAEMETIKNRIQSVTNDIFDKAEY